MGTTFCAILRVINIMWFLELNTWPCTTGTCNPRSQNYIVLTICF